MQKPLAKQIQTIITDAYIFFTRHLKQIALVCAPFLFVASLSDFILAEAYKGTHLAIFAPLAVNLLIYPIYTAALIQLMAKRARQEQPTSSELIIGAIQRWVPLLILKTISVFLIGLGISMLIFPGIWLAIRLAFAEFHLVLFGVNPREAIQKSFEDTKKHLALVFMLLLMTYIPIFVAGLAADQLVQVFTSNDLFRIIVNAIWSLIGLFVHVVLFRAFMDVISEPEAPQPSPMTEE